MTQASPLHAFLSALADHALLGRLFFASVEMAVLAGVVWLIMRMRRRASPRLCSILWLLVMGKALVALAIGAPLAIIRIHPPEPEPFAVTYEPSFDYEDTVPSFEPETTLPLVAIEPGPPEAAPPAGWSFSWKWSAAETVSGAWIIGAILVALYAALNRVRLHRLVCRAMPPPAGIIERYSAAVKHLRVKRPPKLLVTNDLESPALVGTLSPAILLPAWMSEKLNDAQLDWSLRHELTHWKLGDPFADFVRQLARILFFFHPVTWWASRKWEESAELACDRVVVNTESEAENYAGELYQILAQIHGRRTRLVMGGLFATRTQIGRRIAALLSNPLKWPARLGIVATLCLAVMAVISCTIGAAFVKSTRETSLDEIRRVYAARADAIRTLRLSWEGELVLARDDSSNADYPPEPRSLKKKGWLVIAGESNRIEREMEIWNGTRQDVTPGFRMIDVFDEGIGKSLRPNLSSGEISLENELIRSVETKYMTASHRKAPEFLTREDISILREENTPEGLRTVIGTTDYGMHYEIDEDTGRMRFAARQRTEWLLDPRRDYILTEWRGMKPDGAVVWNAVIDYEYQEGVVGYIPQQFVFERRSIDDLSIVVEAQTLRITGFRLNEPVDPKLFTLEFPPGTEVYDDRPEPEPLVNKAAPELDVAGWVSGEPATLESQRGKTVVLAFWDHTDEACADLVQLLNDMLTEYSEKGLEIISIHNADAKPDALKDFISGKSVKLRVAVDKPARRYKGATFERYLTEKVPAVFIIDRKGKVRYQDIPLAAVEEAVKMLVGEKIYMLEEITAGLKTNLAKVGSYRSRYTVVFHKRDGRTTYIREVLTWKYDPESWPDRQEPRRFEQWRYANRIAFWFRRPAAHFKVTFDGEQTSYTEIPGFGGLVNSTPTSVHEGLHASAWGRGLTLAELAGRRVDVDPVERLLENGTFRVEQVLERDDQPLVVLYGKVVRPDADDKEMTTPGSYMRLWLDPQRGFMPVRQEEYAIRVDQPEPKRFMVFTSDLDEVAPGVWFPCAGTYETSSQRAELKRETIDLNIELNDKTFRLAISEK